MPALKACKHSHIQELPWNVKIKFFNAEIVARLMCGCLCGAAKTRVVTSDSLTRKSSIPESGLSSLKGDGDQARPVQRMTSELPAPIFILQNWLTHASVQSKEAQWHMWEVTFTLVSLRIHIGFLQNP